MPPLLEWIVNYFIEKRLPIILLIVNPQIITCNTLIQRKEWLLSPLVSRYNNHFVTMGNQIIGFIG